MKNHLNMMWACVALAGLVIALAVGGVDGSYLLLAVGCIAMMGAMVWMMLGGPRGGSGPSAGDH